MGGCNVHPFLIIKEYVYMYNIKIKIIHPSPEDKSPGSNGGVEFEATLEYFNHRTQRFVTAFERGKSPVKARNKLISLLNSGSRKY
jgi:hypothetical protein